MQSTTILLDLHDAIVAARCCPEQVIIGADNTVKETKNTTTFVFAVWFLAALEGCPLWNIQFAFLMVGHTHDALAMDSVRAARL